MNPDERLESLARSVEGLKESVELLAGMHQSTEKEIQKTGKQLQGFMRFTQLVLFDHANRLLKLEHEDGDEAGTDEAKI
jgi:predicted nucleotidyltransferase